MTYERIALEFVLASTAAQGLPEFIESPWVLAKVAAQTAEPEEAERAVA